MNIQESDIDQNQSNEITLQSYNANISEFIRGTPSLVDGALKIWIDRSLSLLPKDSKILELGSGLGRDAEYIRSRGYNIECSDAVAGFVKFLREKHFTARRLNVLKNTVDNRYDMIFANAVLLHFTTQEAAMVLDKIYTALPDKGMFTFSVKQGDGYSWTQQKLGAPRYFQYWQLEPLKQLVTSHGFEWEDVSRGYTQYNKANWLYVIARKVL